jgi:hypothetical protein
MAIDSDRVVLAWAPPGRSRFWKIGEYGSRRLAESERDFHRVRRGPETQFIIFPAGKIPNGVSVRA